MSSALLPMSNSGQGRSLALEDSDKPTAGVKASLAAYIRIATPHLYLPATKELEISWYARYSRIWPGRDCCRCHVERIMMKYSDMVNAFIYLS